MSTPRWFRSRSGLVACPACAAHVRFADGECAFCSTPLAPPQRATAGRLGARGAVLAASLVALGTLGTAGAARADEPAATEPAEAGPDTQGDVPDAPPEDGADAPVEAPEDGDWPTAQPIYGTVASPVDDAPNWTITVDPLTTALGFVHVQVEYALAKRWSIYAGPHLRLFSSPLTAEEGEVDDLKGYGAELGVRYFLWGDAPEGLWMMMRGVGGFGTTGETDGFVGYISHLVGYTWIWDDWLVLAGGGGIQYLTYSVDGQGPDRGMAPALHTNIGVAF